MALGEADSFAAEKTGRVTARPRVPSRPGGAAPVANRATTPGPQPVAQRRPPVGRVPSPDDTRPPTSSPASRFTIEREEDHEPTRADEPPREEPRAVADERAKLIHTTAEGQEVEFTLEDVNYIGRHPKNTIRLHDREVSKEHAVIERRADKFYLRDLNSSNGSFVNSKKIRDAELHDGDEIMLGSMRLRFASSKKSGEKGESPKELVTILPVSSEPSGVTHIHATIADHDEDFRPADDIHDVEILKADYEKLRVAHELARVGLDMNVSTLLKKTLDVAFSLFPCDNGVVLLVDPDNGQLIPHTVKRRDAGVKHQEIVLSSTIINQVLNNKTSILLSDAFLDPRLQAAQSIISQGIRSAMTVPLLANEVVYGVMHIDSRQRIGAFKEKDLSLLKSLASQAATAIANNRLLKKVEDDARTRGQLSRFLPPHVVEAMVAGKGSNITKGGRECHAAVLFCDIRGFTTMSENASGPQEIVDLLNDYFERLVEIVFERHGVLDKFIGDALMAHWGTLPGDEDPVFNAVAAALDFRDAIRGFNEERAAEGLAPIGMGVGVNYGKLVAGYMGAKRRLEYTVIGDTVNTASRLCGIADADQVLISQETYREVEDRVEGRRLGSRQVKGKEHGVEVYECLSVREGASARSLSETGS
ncbi:MAG: FHA domain-containing protein [Deltaproteobacteria bacterium]|nr:FHA domain-containing protein [Deltaproteobacteria bacterium]